jgi:tetratricopeptide (TPR) repeat protein
MQPGCRDAARRLGMGSFVLAELLFSLATLAMPAQNPPPASPKKRVAPGSSRAAASTKAFDELAKQATAAREADHPEEAIKLYESALKLNPKWSEGWFYLGTLFYDANQYADAIVPFRRTVELSPVLGPSWAMLGLCEFETGDYKNSIIHLQKGRTLGLGGNQELTTVTRYHEAMLLNTVGEFELATELLDSLITQGSESINVKIALGLSTLRVPLLPSQLDPSRDAVVHAVGEVAAKVAVNDLDQALAGYRQLLEDFPKTPYLHYAYGNALMSLSRFDEAEQQFLEEMKISPDSALPYMYLAYVQLRTKKFQEALPTSQAAVRLAPNAFPAHYLLGRTYLELAEIPEAIKELEAARRLGPYSPEVRYNLARAYSRAHRNGDAAQERKEFTRLSALMERQRGTGAGTSYRSSSERGTLSPGELTVTPPPKN